MKVEIWSDIACPWCYIGKRRFEKALRGFEHAAEVSVAWRSFELDPASPPVREGDPTRALAAKYGISVEQAADFQARMTRAAAEEGLSFDFSALRPGNTFDAHRLLHLAGELGRGDKLHERLFAAYLCEGQAIGDRGVLARLAEESGIDAERARNLIGSDTYGDRVHAEEQEAAELGISGVPFFVIDRTYGLSGAQPSDRILAALRQAWAERPRSVPVQVRGDSEGETASCEDGRCNVPARGGSR